MRTSRAPQLYFALSTICLMAATGFAVAGPLSPVVGADSCGNTCYNDTFEYYECFHTNPNPPGPPDANGCPTNPPVVPNPGKGCIRDIRYYSFCNPQASGGNCPFQNTGNSPTLKQWANMTVDCTSTTNPTNAWNAHNPGPCEYIAFHCTSMETTGCANATVEGALRSFNAKNCP